MYTFALLLTIYDKFWLLIGQSSRKPIIDIDQIIGGSFWIFPNYVRFGVFHESHAHSNKSVFRTRTHSNQNIWIELKVQITKTVAKTRKNHGVPIELKIYMSKGHPLLFSGSVILRLFIMQHQQRPNILIMILRHSYMNVHNYSTELLNCLHYVSQSASACVGLFFPLSPFSHLIVSNWTAHLMNIYFCRTHFNSFFHLLPDDFYFMVFHIKIVLVSQTSFKTCSQETFG